MAHVLRCSLSGSWVGSRPRGRITILIIVLIFAGWLIRQGNDLNSVAAALTVITSVAASFAGRSGERRMDGDAGFLGQER